MVLTEKSLQNAYIGEVYEYSYDFRNKTLSQITADGWDYSAGNTPYFGNYGVYGNPGPVRLSYNISSHIQNAKRISISFIAKKGSSTDGGVRIAKTVTSSLRDGLSGPGFGPSYTYMDIYSNSHTYSSISAGIYQFDGVIDLTSKTWELSITGMSTKTGTLTDTEVSNILTNTTKLFVYAGTGNSDIGISTVKLTIE